MLPICWKLNVDWFVGLSCNNLSPTLWTWKGVNVKTEVSARNLFVSWPTVPNSAIKLSPFVSSTIKLVCGVGGIPSKIILSVKLPSSWIPSPSCSPKGFCAKCKNKFCAIILPSLL